MKIRFAVITIALALLLVEPKEMPPKPRYVLPAMGWMEIA